MLLRNNHSLFLLELKREMQEQVWLAQISRGEKWELELKREMQDLWSAAEAQEKVWLLARTQKRNARYTLLSQVLFFLLLSRD